jgi:hypothetical protein
MKKKYFQIIISIFLSLFKLVHYGNNGWNWEKELFVWPETYSSRKKWFFLVL